MEKVEGAGVELAYSERGAGPLVLVIHGLASDAAAWEPFARDLAADARVVVYDRRGYGSSGAPEPYEGTTVEEQAQDAAALLRALGQARQGVRPLARQGVRPLVSGAHPAVVVGDGFGSLVALDLMKRHAPLVAGAVLSDPPLFAFVAEATEALADERVALEEALRDGGPEAAVAVWLGGRAEDEPLARARAAHRGFFADYAGLASWPVTRRELRALDAPAVVVTGPRTPHHVVAAADSLASLLPAARRADDGDLAAAARSLAAASRG